MESLMKYLLIGIFGLLIWQPAQACDICSCGSGGGVMGVMPQFHKNFVSAGFQYSRFNHPQTAYNTTNGKAVLRDAFVQYRLDLRYYLNPGLQLMAAMPYGVNTRVYNDHSEQIQAMSDPELRLGWMLFNTTDSMYRPVRHMLMLGTGTGIPSGKYQQRNPEKLMYPNNFQLGSGAWSPQLFMMYTLRKGAWGLNLQSAAVFPLENELQYQRGNYLANHLFLFYWKNVKDLRLLPHASFSSELRNADRSMGTTEQNTGGSAFFAGCGLDVFSGRLAARASVQTPLYQQTALAQPKAQWRLSGGVGLFF